MQNNLRKIRISSARIEKKGLCVTVLGLSVLFFGIYPEHFLALLMGNGRGNRPISGTHGRSRRIIVGSILPGSHFFKY